MNTRFVPPTFTPPATPMGILRFIPRFLKNPLETLPAQVFTNPAFKVVLFRQEMLLLTDPEAVGTVLQNRDGLYPKGKLSSYLLGPLLGEGLFTSSGDHWKWQRQTVSPAFQHRKLEALIPKMAAPAIATAEELCAASHNTPVDAARFLRETTLHIIAETMLTGNTPLDMEETAKEAEVYIRSVPWRFGVAMFGLPQWFPHPYRWKMHRAAGRLRKNISTLVCERHNAPPQGDLIDLLLAAQHPQSGERMTDTMLVDNILTFLAAGHETSAQTLAWTLYLITAHPPTKARVLEEIDTHIPLGATIVHPQSGTATASSKNSDTAPASLAPSASPAPPAPLVPPVAINAEMLKHLVYTRQVIQEAMRLYPPASAIFRQAAQSVTWFGRTIRADSLIEIPIYAIHRHKALWNDPDAFDPSRFATDKVKSHHKYAYLPFGAGPRICIGATFAMLETLAVLAVLLRRVDFRLDPDHRVWPESYLTLRPRGGLPMFVQARMDKQNPKEQKSARTANGGLTNPRDVQ